MKLYQLKVFNNNLLFKLTLFFFLSQNLNAQVGINTTTPNAQLDIVASNATTPNVTDGILIPRVNAFPATNPTADQNSMLVYLTTTVGTNTPGFYFWDNASTTWVQLETSNSSVKTLIEDTDKDTKIQVEENTDEDKIRFDVSGTERIVLEEATTNLDIVGGYTQSNAQFTLQNTGLALVPDGTSNSSQIISVQGQYPGPNYPYAKIDLRNNDQGTIYTGASIRSHNDGSVNDGDLRFFTTNNQTLSERMRINSFGNVSIGGVSNNGRLYVKMSNATSYFPNWSAGGGKIITQVHVGDAANPQTRFYNTGLDFYDVGLDGTGNFTIEENDQEKFAIRSGAVRISNAYALPITDGTSGQILVTDGAGNLTWQSATTDVLITDADDDTKIQVEESADEDTIRFDTAGSQKMIINSAGDIGIGTNTPETALHIERSSGDAKLLLNAKSTSNESRLEFRKFANNFSSAIGYYPGNAELRIRTNQNNAILFEPNATEAFRIMPSGNIGVSETNPQEKLHINGNLRMVDGNQATGKVLTSDASGTATWQTPTSEILEKGSVNITNSPTGTAIETINFTGAYTTAPQVHITVESGNYGEFYIANVKFKSTTSFEIHVFRADSPGDPVDSVTVNWIATN